MFGVGYRSLRVYFFLILDVEYSICFNGGILYCLGFWVVLSNGFVGFWYIIFLWIFFGFIYDSIIFDILFSLNLFVY